MKRNQIIPKVMRLPVFLSVICNAAAYYGSRLLTSGRHHFDLSCRLDEQIPFVPWTVVIYFGCYAFWLVNYVIGCRQDIEKAFRFMSADLLAKLVCMICFLVFPTTNVRPEIRDTSLWDELMRLLYRVDAADNLFPSIHCLNSGFCLIAVRGNRNVPKWYQAASFLIVVSICVSTLTTKQHVLIDVAAGIALSEISWHFVKISGLSKRYMDSILKAEVGITKKEESVWAKE